jgi:SAM-dependent methyltransferase
MPEASRHDAWQAGDSYDRYMGRWSRRIAPRFLDWIAVPAGAAWFEVGCGTGALSTAIIEHRNPQNLVGIDPSEGFVAHARAHVVDPRASFRVGDALSLDAASQSFDAVVSALVLNFVPDRSRALSEMRRAARSGGTIAFYVWDYPGGGVEFMRAFWDAATALDPKAHDLGEGRRFPFCNPDDLTQLMHEAGLGDVACTAIEAPAVFADFDDFWQPFTLGTGPAPGYCMSLEAAARERLRQRLEASLPRTADGAIPLKVRAWAAKGVAP